MENPIIVAIPNTIEEKMKAIKLLSKSIHELSKAINSINVNVEISNCNITSENNVGILVDLNEK